MIKYCLQTFIYPKSICNSRPQWRIYHKLGISHICWSEIKVLPTIRALIHIVSIYNSSSPKGTAPVNPAPDYPVLVQKIVCTQAREACCMMKENTNACWHEVIKPISVQHELRKPPKASSPSSAQDTEQALPCNTRTGTQSKQTPRPLALQTHSIP